jgi:putative Mn2+ efflux pump MntP
LRLVALVVPLALDTFAVCAALAAGGLPRSAQRRVGVVVVGFEAAMPIVGLVAGRGAAAVVSGAAEWIGLGCLAAVGAWLLVEREEPVGTREPGVGGLLLLGVAVSLDEIGVGFSFGLLRIRLAPAIALIAVQAVVASQLGFRLGARATRAGDLAARGAGAALIVVAGALAAAQLL